MNVFPWPFCELDERLVDFPAPRYFGSSFWFIAASISCEKTWERCFHISWYNCIILSRDFISFAVYGFTQINGPLYIFRVWSYSFYDMWPNYEISCNPKLKLIGKDILNICVLTKLIDFFNFFEVFWLCLIWIQSEF